MVSDLWDRVERMCGAFHPEVPGGGLRPPAALAWIQAAEQTMGLEFPADLRAAYLRFNGLQPEVWPFTLLPGGFHWLGLDGERARMLDTWRILDKALAQERAENLGFDADQAENDREADAEGRPSYARFLDTGRIPVATRYMADGLYVDMRPARAGMPGQVIHVDPQSPDCPVVAPSFSALVLRMVCAHEAGQIRFDAEDGWIHSHNGQDVTLWSSLG